MSVPITSLNIDMLRLGRILKRKRKESGLRIEDLADSLISSAIISLIERGKINQITSKVQYLCEKLEIDLYNNIHLEDEEDLHDDLIFHQLVSTEHLLDLRKTNPDEAIKIINQLKLNEKHSYYPYLLLLKAKAYIRKGQISKAIPHLRQCIELCPQEDDMNLHATAYSNLAVCCYLANDPKQALSYVQDGLKVFTLDGDRQYLYYNLQIDEIIYLEKLGRKQEALYKIHPLFELREKLTLDARLNLHEIYGRILLDSDIHIALDVLSQGLEVARKNGNYARTVELSVQLGKAYELLNKTDIAEIYYELALKLEKEVDYKAFLIDAYVARSKLFLQKGASDKAEEYLLKGLEIGVKYDEKIRLYEVYLSLGNLAYSSEDIHKAIGYFEKGAIAADQLKMNHLKERALVSLIDCYKQLGDREQELTLLNKLYETKKEEY